MLQNPAGNQFLANLPNQMHSQDTAFGGRERGFIRAQERRATFLVIAKFNLSWGMTGETRGRKSE